MIKKAKLSEALDIYKYMQEAFPENEIPNREDYEQLTKENIHQVYLYEEDEKNMAYFISLENNNKVLISHLAVIKEYRGNGVGKRFLEEIKQFLSNKNMLIVEVEAEQMATNKQELDIIQRRKRYYLKAGFKKCEGMKYRLFGVNYEILVYEKTNEFPSNEKVKKTIEKIYDFGDRAKRLDFEIILN